MRCREILCGHHALKVLDNLVDSSPAGLPCMFIENLQALTCTCILCGECSTLDDAQWLTEDDSIDMLSGSCCASRQKLRPPAEAAQAARLDELAGRSLSFVCCRQ